MHHKFKVFGVQKSRVIYKMIFDINIILRHIEYVDAFCYNDIGAFDDFTRGIASQSILLNSAIIDIGFQNISIRVHLVRLV